MARLKCLQQLYVSKPFRELRFCLIVKCGCKCEHCGRIFADTSKLIAHHKIELTADNVNDPIIALNPDLIDILCEDCHNNESNRFSVSSRRVYLVYGSPLSGKTSAVRDMMRRGDLIVDIDRIWGDVTMCPPYDKPNNVRFNVFAVRNLLLDNIKTRYGKWFDAYVVGGYADRFERERLAADLGAEIIYCEATREECLERLQKDASRLNVIFDWTRYINEWWERFEGVPPVDTPFNNHG